MSLDGADFGMVEDADAALADLQRLHPQPGVPISVTLFKRVVLTLWHAFLFLGLRFFSPSFLLFAWWPPLLSLHPIYDIDDILKKKYFKKKKHTAIVSECISLHYIFAFVQNNDPGPDNHSR
jgi:hypothetical protein